MKKTVLLVISILACIWAVWGLTSILDFLSISGVAMREMKNDGEIINYSYYYMQLAGIFFSGLLFPISILTTCIGYLKNHKYKKISLYITLGFIAILLLSMIYSVWAIYQETR